MSIHPIGYEAWLEISIHQGHDHKNKNMNTSRDLTARKDKNKTTRLLKMSITQSSTKEVVEDDLVHGGKGREKSVEEIQVEYRVQMHTQQVKETGEGEGEGEGEDSVV